MIFGNMFPLVAAPVDISGWNFPKAALKSGSIATMTAFENAGAALGFAVQPGLDFGPGNGTAECLAVDFFLFSELNRFDILGAGGAGATLSAVTDIAVAATSFPPDADQPGAFQDIETNDERFSGNVFQIGNSIWAVHCITGTGGLASLRWYELDWTTNTVLQSGTIEHPTLDLYYPSIAVNAQGCVCIGCTGSSSTVPPSTYVVCGSTSAGVTTFAAPVQTQCGTGLYVVLDGIGRNRWGDYSATVVDPTNSNIFWTFQEFVSSTNVWSIQITQLIKEVDVVNPYLVTDNSDCDVTVFDGSTDTYVNTISIPDPGGTLLDCCITPDGSTGFVLDFTDRVWVLDLAADPPQLAAGTNPIIMTNQQGENCCVTCDGQYLLVCNGGGTEPVSVIDIAARAEASFFPLQAGVGCTEVECCDDGVSVLGVGTDQVLRRLTIDGGGNLTDTGESLAFGNVPINVCCASGSLVGVVVEDFSGQITSFTIPGLIPVDTRALTGDIGLSCAICWDGSAIYVRSRDNAVTTGWVDCFGLDRYTGALTPTPTLTIPGIQPSETFFGVNQLVVNLDCSKLYVPEGVAVDVTSVFDAATGALITTIVDPNNQEPKGICCPPCCEPCILYAADGSQGNPSDLLILDPTTGGVIRNVGPIGFAVTGLAVDPFDGTLYGSTARASGTRALITVNKTTGAGTLVGNFNIASESMADIDFCPDGTLLGWSEPGFDDLTVINKATGQAQIIGDSDQGTARAGLAVDQTGNVFYGGQNNFGDGLLLLDPYFGQVFGNVPYVPSGDFGLGMSFDPANVLYAIERVNVTNRNLVTINTTSGVVTTIGATVNRLDALAWDCPEPCPPIFKKTLIDGPDRNFDFQIDPIIERKSHTPSTWTFKITVKQVDLPPMMVVDVIPPWRRLLDCTADDPGDIVQITVGPSDRDFHKVRPRIITWFPSGNEGCLTCTVITRKHSSNRYEPHDCGGFFINEGAQAFDTGGLPLFDPFANPLITRPICVGVVKDKNHDDFIDWTGNGDEDEDTLSDWFECCVLGTDPCDDDTDGDHVDDNVDADPLDKDVQ